MTVGKYEVRDGLSRFMHGRIQAMLADAYQDGSNKAFYDAAVEAVPFMVIGGAGVPAPMPCTIAGVKCERVSPDWCAENIDAMDAIEILNECLKASEVAEQEAKN